MEHEIDGSRLPEPNDPIVVSCGGGPEPFAKRRRKGRSVMSGGRSEAVGYATPKVPIAEPGDTAGEIRRRLVGVRYESVEEVAVCTGDRLVGLVCLEDLLASDNGTIISDLMDADPPTFAPGADQEVVARKAVEHGEGSLAVVDAAGRFVGLIPPARLLSVLLDEHDEDLARLGGYLHSTESARRAAEEPVTARFRHRLPWLLIGLVGALLAAVIVGRYEAKLSEDLIIAFFVPGIVYLADAVGTQTETLMVRGLSVGTSVRTTARKEVITGVLVGATLAAVFIPIGLLVWERGDVVAAVALALFAACSVATIVAMLLPALLARLGTDPAFGSGPLATVIQDLLSILIYFAVATAIVG